MTVRHVFIMEQLALMIYYFFKHWGCTLICSCFSAVVCVLSVRQKFQLPSAHPPQAVFVPSPSLAATHIPLGYLSYQSCTTMSCTAGKHKTEKNFCCKIVNVNTTNLNIFNISKCWKIIVQIIIFRVRFHLILDN